jgi:hypothetical protein
MGITGAAQRGMATRIDGSGMVRTLTSMHACCG